MFFDKETLTFYNKEANNLIDKVEGIQTVNVSSVDGFEIVSILKEKKEFNQNLSAMSSSILALINSLLKEFSFPNSDFLEINAEKGVILVAPLKMKEIDLVVLIQANDKPTKGELTYYIKEFLKNLRNI